MSKTSTQQNKNSISVLSGETKIVDKNQALQVNIIFRVKRPVFFLLVITAAEQMLSDCRRLGTGQASVSCLCCDWLSERALPAYTFLPGCPRWTEGLQSWTCQLAPRSPSYEESGAHCKAEVELRHESGGSFIHSLPAGPDLIPAEDFIWWHSS